MHKVGVIGIRGYGVVYSGFETFVKNLIKKDSSGKFFYYLFCRNIYQTKRFRSKKFKLIVAPVIDNKYLETLSYNIASTIVSLFIRDLKIILYLGVANTPLIFFQKLLQRKVAVNVDGIDWQRKRWPTLGKLYLKICEKLSVRFANVLICDSKVILNYYRKKYKINNLVYIPYGAEVRKRAPGGIIKFNNLKPNKYLLFVGRLVPENSVEDLILAFKKIKTNYKCVIVGDSVHEDKYKNFLLNLARDDPRLIFTGFLKEKNYEEICSNAYVYVETKSVGGTHPSLLEAMAFGNCTIAKNINEHKEVLGDCGLYYNKALGFKDLRRKMMHLLKTPSLVKSYGKMAKSRVNSLYRWEIVTEHYRNIFQKIIS